MAIRKKQVLLIGLIPVVILIGAAIYLFAAGHLYLRVDIGQKGPDQKVVVYRDVCTQQIRDKYVEVVQSTPVPSVESLTPLHDQIEGIDRWQADPSCVFIQVQYYVAAGEEAKVAELNTKLNQLSDDGLFPNTAIARYGYIGESAEGTARLQKEGALSSGQGGI